MSDLDALVYVGNGPLTCYPARLQWPEKQIADTVAKLLASSLQWLWTVNSGSAGRESELFTLRPDTAVLFARIAKERESDDREISLFGIDRREPMAEVSVDQLKQWMVAFLAGKNGGAMRLAIEQVGDMSFAYVFAPSSIPPETDSLLKSLGIGKANRKQVRYSLLRGARLEVLAEQAYGIKLDAN